MTRTEFLGLTKREPNDKYNLAENNENLDRIDLFAQTIATGIVGIPVEETGVSISLTDASNNNLKNLVVFGNTTQTGTPTPENPIDLDSVKNPTVTINGKNLLDKGNVTKEVYIADGTLQSNNLFSMFEFIPVNKGEAVTLSAKYIGTENEYLRWAIFDKNKNFISRYNATPKSENVVIDIEQDGFIRVFISTTNYDEATAQLEIGNTATTYEPYKSQTLSVPYTLNGVGDVRDYVDFERGVLVRNTHSVDLSTLTWTMPYNGIFNSVTLPFNGIGNPSNTANSKALCSAYIAGSVAGKLGVYNSANTNKVISLSQGASVSSVSIKNLGITNLADFKASMNGVMFIYQLAIPTETPLTAEEIEAFKQLQSYYPVTTITNNENAEMGVEYFADTKIYIDNKFAELNRAILNNI